jgi:hypothetical protein
VVKPDRSIARRAEKGGLPNFVLVGAPRCGTTSISTYLSQHPDVHIAPQKEVHFFDHRFDRGLDWYRAQFDRASDERVVGEASPNYMFSEEAMQRMAGLLPDAKLIVMLREPVARAYSAYWFNEVLRPDRLSFEEAIEAENQPGFVPKYRRSGLLGGSTYLPGLERITRFYPRSALIVLLLEDLKKQPDETFASLCRFLEIDDTVKPSTLGRSVNQTHRLRSLRLYYTMARLKAWRRLPFRLGYKIDEWNQVPFEYPPIDPATRERLRAHFADHNAALARWLGRDLSTWNKA